MRILVTGAAGFIGSNLVDKLLSDGHTVFGVDDYSAGHHENLEYAKSFGHHQFSDMALDVSALPPLLIEYMEIDTIFHLACSKKTVCLKDPYRDLEVNAGGTLRLLQAAKAAGVKRFIHASTGSVYGEVAGKITEQTPVNPCSYYGISKLAGERYVNLYQGMGMDTTILRFFHVYGPRQETAPDRGGVIGIFCNQLLDGKRITIYGDGNQERSFTSVFDIVDAMAFCLANSKTIGQVYNIASGIKVSINDMAARLCEMAGKEFSPVYGDWQPGDIVKFDVSNEKLKNAGFAFRQSFGSGLYQTFKWYMDNRGI